MAESVFFLKWVARSSK